MSELQRKPDYQTFANNLKSCATSSNIKLGRSIHSTIIKLGLNSCHLVTKSLLNMYAKCNLLNESHHIFKHIANPDIVTWNIMLSGLSGSRVYDREVVKMFDRMKLGENVGVRASAVSVAIVVPVCVRLRGVGLGKSVHCYVVKSGLERETLVGNAFVSMYLKMGRVWDAWNVFDGMCERDVVSWNAVVAGLVENGLVFEGFRVFRDMIGEGVWPNYATIVNVLPVCGVFGDGCGLRFGKEIHCYAMRRGEVFGDVSVVNSLVGFYSKVGRMNEAESLFDRMCLKDLVSWNSMISGYASNGEWLKGLDLFRKFTSLDLTKPDSVTLLTVLTCCANLQNLQAGKQIHGYIIRHPSLCDITSVGNSLINFYSKCGDLDSAFRSFSLISIKDLISWNSILDALAEGQLVKEFYQQLHIMFQEDVKPDSITIVTVIQYVADSLQSCLVKEAHGFSVRCGLFPGNREPTLANALIDAYARCENMEYASKIFNILSGNTNVVTCNSLISGYVNSGLYDDAKIIFKNMTERDLTTWNLMVRAYALNGYFHQAVELFHEFQNHKMKPDNMTIMSVLPVATQMASVQMVRQCHGYVVRACFQDVQLLGAFLDAYSKCGNLYYASKLFESAHYKDLVMYTSMVGGYAIHGMGEKALRVYYQMVKNGGKPDHVIITTILSACSHSGLVDEGLKIFHSRNEVCIKPTMELYASVVDLLARNGRINDAYGFITSMPIEPSANVWGALLGACKNHDEVEMGCVVADHLLKIEENNMGNYVVMSNIYAAKDKWEEVMEIRRLMKTKDLKKPAGCSWIEVDGKKNVFIAGDTSHPLRMSIVNMLCNLNEQVTERFQL
ncbi:tetratricopeptide repeat (TPR)-like superfamily protein [Artemisia annua]|uniref:Tetratricopeptide repeat (TPR)-like superfamily protein n=1 Tax=Artemisia annua TaxID=35608 RepID=A0A2U1MH18_ARTAN|nr:tetratricopeptide repeat (TPR)-like superfamily protein [Artemisia annua]